MLSAGQFGQLNDIIQRYDSLVEKRNDLLDKRTKELDDLDTIKTVMLKMMEQKKLCIIQLNQKVVKLTQRHEEARQNALKWESIVSEIKGETNRRQGEMNCIRKGIYNIYKQMAERQTDPPNICEQDVGAQCIFVNRVMEQMQMLLKRVNRLTVFKQRSERVKSKIIVLKPKPKKSKKDIDSKIGSAHSLVKKEYFDF